MLTTQLIRYCFSKKERLWLLPVITLLILLIPTLSLALLTTTGNTYTIQCPTHGGIKDFTINPDPAHAQLYLLLNDGTIEVDDASTGANIKCDNTYPSITPAANAIIIQNSTLYTNTHSYNITYILTTPVFIQQPQGSGTHAGLQQGDVMASIIQTGDNHLIEKSEQQSIVTEFYYYISNTSTSGTSTSTIQILNYIYRTFTIGNTLGRAQNDHTIRTDTYNPTTTTIDLDTKTGTIPVNDRFAYYNSLNTTYLKRENAIAYDPTTQFIYYPVTNATIKGLIRVIDFSIGSPTAYGYCNNTAGVDVKQIYQVTYNEVYAFGTDGNQFRCDFTNTVNPTTTTETGLTGNYYYYKTFPAPYNNKLWFAHGTAGNDTATEIIQITGFSGGVTPVPPNTTTTTTNNLTQLSIYQQPGYTFTDMSISNNIAHINSIDANSTATYIAVDAGSPSQLGSVTQKRIVKDYLNQTKNNAKGITSQDNWVFGAATDTLYYWTPAQTAANTLGTQTNTAITFLIDSNYYDFRDAAPLGNNQYVACLYNNKNDLYNQPHTEIYLINATNSTSLNYTDWGDAGSDECYSLVADQSSKYAYYTTPTSIVFINTSQPGGVSGSITYQNTPNIHNPGMLTYDVTNHNLLIATGTTGLDVIHLNNPTSTTYVMTCTPSGSLTITSGAATYNMNTLIGVGMQAYPPYNLAYFCPLTTGTTAPTSVQRIIQAQPLEAQTINNIIYIMGSNSLAAYIFTNTTTNNTIPPVVGTASATFTFINENNQPVPNVVSILSNYITSQTYTSVSNANGTATHANVPAGTYIWLYQPPSPYTDGSAQVTLATNEQLTYTQTLTTQAINPGLPNGTGTSQNRTCQDFIKNVWLCNMENTPCTTNLDCPSGQCETYAGGGKCSSFNYNLCDADNTPRNQRCVIKMTFKGIMAAIVNHILRYFLYYTILLIIIFLIAALLISRRRK